MSEPILFPLDKQLATDLLLEKRLVLISMQDLDKHFEEEPPSVQNLSDVDRLTKIFMSFDGDLEALEDEVVILEMFCNWQMN